MGSQGCVTACPKGQAPKGPLGARVQGLPSRPLEGHNQDEAVPSTGQVGPGHGADSVRTDR